MRIQKSDSNSVFDNISHKYKNAFNDNKLLKRTFIKKIYIIITKNFYYKKCINIYIVKKTQKIICMKKKVKKKEESEKEVKSERETEDSKKEYFRNI